MNRRESDPEPIRPRNRGLSDEAIDWHVRLSARPGDSGLAKAYADWRARSPAHAQAADEAAVLLAAIGDTSAADAYREARRVLVPAPSTGWSRRAFIGGAAAASVAAITVGAATLGPALIADHTTGVGERKSIILADGTHVWLNTATALSVNFSDGLRELTLHAGEILFEAIAANPVALIVKSQGGDVRALAGGFSVLRLKDRTRVQVSEGEVDIRTGEGALTLAAGQQSVFGHRLIGAAQAIDTEAATAWRRGKLTFNRRPLADVVTEMARYSQGYMVVVGEQLKATRVTGVFELNDLEGALTLIAENTGAKVTRLPLLTVIRSA